MERTDHLKYCKVCFNQKFEMSQGIICGLTNKIADFEDKCEFFSENAELKKQMDSKDKANEFVFNGASQGKRLANHILDLIFSYIFIIILGVFVGIALGLLAPEFISDFNEDNFFLNYVIGFIGLMIYFTLFEYTTGRTLAKMITKTKVIDENGVKPGLGTILLRSLCRFIPFDAFSFLGEDGMGWHDRISKTKVVNI